MMNRTRLSVVFAFLLFCLSDTGLVAADESNLLESRKGAAGNFFHTGMWVEDIDQMLEFLSLIMDYQVLSRGKRPDGGERVMLSDSRGQLLELLSDPKNVTAHDEFRLHPLGRVAGIAHVSIQVENVEQLKSRLLENHYQLIAQAPAAYEDAYLSVGQSEYRILFIEGPSGVSFELFEIR